MKGIQYKLEEGGRAGDQARTLYGIFVFAKHLGLEICYEDVLLDTHQGIGQLRTDFFKQDIVKKLFTDPSKYTNTVEVYKGVEWVGMKWKTFAETCKAIEAQPEGTLCQLIGQPRIEPWKIHNWVDEGLLEWNVKEFAKEKYTQLVQGGFNIKEKEEVCIHIRRGDLAEVMRQRGYDIEYYKLLIKKIKEVSDLPITIFTESMDLGYKEIFDVFGECNSNDLEPLNDIEGVTLERGALEEFDDHVSRMLGCSHLFATESGFTKAIFYAKSYGKMYIDANIFGNSYDRMPYYNFPENLKRYSLIHKMDL